MIGILMQPNIVRQVRNTETGVVTITEPTEVRQVLSSRTAELLMEMSEYTVTDGTGGHARVTGFSVGGKSGTSEPPVGREYQGVIASFVGMAPIVDSEVVVLVLLHNPRGELRHGGQIAAPVVSQILTEVLPYLGVPSAGGTSPNHDDTSGTNAPVILPDVRNRTITEARNLLSNFTIHISGHEDESTTLITDQLPLPGVYLFRRSDIFLFTANNDARITVAVPDVRRMSLPQATNSLSSRNLNIVSTGSGVVTHQNIAPGTLVPQGTVITVTLQPQVLEAH